jgi:hypothetical protein
MRRSIGGWPTPWPRLFIGREGLARKAIIAGLVAVGGRIARIRV